MCKLPEKDQTKACAGRSTELAAQRPSESKANEQADRLVWVVRNTFLTIEGAQGEPTGRRSASEPPAVRHADAPGADAAVADAEKVRRASAPAAPQKAAEVSTALSRPPARSPAPARTRPTSPTHAAEAPACGPPHADAQGNWMSIPVVGGAGFYGYWAVAPMAPWMLPHGLPAFPMPEEARPQPAAARRQPGVAGYVDVACLDGLVAQLSEGGAVGDMALSELRAAFVRLAFDSQGCLTAQSALDAAAEHQLVPLATELQGRIVEAMKCPHANHVVQKIVQVLPPEAVRSLVVTPLAGVACDLARDQYGCRIFQSLLERCPPGEIQWLVEELLAQVSVLCCHKYGNFVIQQILQNGTPEQRGFVARTLAVDPLGFALDKTGSNVVETAFTVCTPEDRWGLFLSLTRSPAVFEALACSKFGNYVARSLLYFGGEQSEAARAHLAGLLPTAGPVHSAWQGSIYGRRVLREFKEVARVVDAGLEVPGPGARQRHQQQKQWRGAACGKGERP